MNDTLIELPESSTLNAEGKPNVPLCPLCAGVINDADRKYAYNRHNPDTRWFWCADCECHLGYHRMKGKWKIDPYDLNTNTKIREYFGLGPAEEEL